MGSKLCNISRVNMLRMCPIQAVIDKSERKFICLIFTKIFNRKCIAHTKLVQLHIFMPSQIMHKKERKNNDTPKS